MVHLPSKGAGERCPHVARDIHITESNVASNIGRARGRSRAYAVTSDKRLADLPKTFRPWLSPVIRHRQFELERHFRAGAPAAAILNKLHGAIVGSMKELEAEGCWRSARPRSSQRIAGRVRRLCAVRDEALGENHQGQPGKNRLSERLA